MLEFIKIIADIRKEVVSMTRTKVYNLDVILTAFYFFYLHNMFVIKANKYSQVKACH